MVHKQITVRELLANESIAWDELVLSSRQGIVYHLHDFLKMWTDTDPALHLVRLGCYDEQGQLVGGQAIIYGKVLGMRIQNTLSIAHTSTPILPRGIQDQVCKRNQVLAALAKESIKYYYPGLNLRGEFHPSLSDARPYLAQGWRVSPKYTHVWDISDPEAILANMQKTRRQDLRSAQKHLLFACESEDAILNEFARLYREDMKKFNWTPERSWEETFRKRVEWMQSKDYFRLYTCRRQDGQLVGMATIILSRLNQTAYGWLLAYDHVLGNREFTPAMYWFSACSLSSEFRYINIGEGTRASLYATKDSFGTSSVLFWIASTRPTVRWIRFYNRLKNIKQSLRKILS